MTKKITVKKCYKIKGDFEDCFISKSGINITPGYDELKLSSRSIASTRYEDIFIIEPNCYYYIEFNEDISSIIGENQFRTFEVSDVLYDIGLLTSLLKNKMYIYNTTQNIIYIEKGAYIGEII